MLSKLSEHYQFALKKATFNLVDGNDGPGEFKIQVLDNIETTANNKELYVEFCRKVQFIPEGIFEIEIIFGIKIPFEGNLDVNVNEVDWVKELETHENPYLSNVITRASNIISNLTAAAGQQPIITPPVFVGN